MEVISINNRKGGSSKTTSAMAFADGLALKGYKVLFIDMDSQFGATSTYNVVNNIPADKIKSLYNVLGEGLPITNAIFSVDETYFTDVRSDYGNISKEDAEKLHRTNSASRFKYKLDIIPSDVRVGEKLKNELKFNVEKALLNALGDLPEGAYDFVVLDTIPAEDAILYNSLVAADDVIVTHTLDEESFRGLEKIQNIIEALNKAKLGEFKISGILITKVNLVTAKKENALQLEKLKAFCEEHGNIPVFENVVRNHPLVDKLKSEHCTIYNEKIISTKVLANGHDNDDEALTVDKILSNKKVYATNEKGKKVTKNKIDYPSVAKDYLRVVNEYLKMKGLD